MGGLKLIVQIPCFNEEASLPITVAALPRAVPGFEHVEWLVIDDGSSDRTVAVARSLGVDHVVQLPKHAGLARAFTTGLSACLDAGADVIVNTDADNQYVAADMPGLVAPILAGRAGMVVGTRDIAAIEHFSVSKKVLQTVGSAVVRAASGTTVRDATCGFRAFSRDAARKLTVFGSYTYTLETIMQARAKDIVVASVPIRTNPDLRQSRLIRSTTSYVARSAWTIVRSAARYRARQRKWRGASH